MGAASRFVIEVRCRGCSPSTAATITMKETIRGKAIGYSSLM